MNTRFTQMSFSRGELSPALYQRTDTKQYAVGLKTLKNGFVHQEGCVSNRAGLEFIGETKFVDSAPQKRLIPFCFNTEDTCILEFGQYYIRFIQNGGYITSGNNIYEIETPYKAEHLQKLKFAQSGDILTIVHLNYAPRELIRYSNTNWTLTPIITNASIAPPTGVTATFSGDADSEGESKEKIDGHWVYHLKHTKAYKYKVTAVDSDTLEESKGSSTAKATGHMESYWAASDKITITWTAVNNAAEYNIYRAVNGVYGYIGTSTTTRFVDDNIEPDLTEAIPQVRNPFAGGNNPACCCYFQQRKLYANTVRNPQTIYASQTATSNNFNVSRPLVASDAIEIALADREVNEIMHLVPFKDLIVLTTNSEYKLNGSDGVFQANPMPIAVIQSSYGSNHVQPIVSGNLVIFVEAGGQVLRDLGYDYLSDGYTGDELSLFANHLFEGKEIIYTAYAKIPYRLIYVVFSDGTMAVLTYNKKQDICGWSRFETDGEVKSAAVVRENNDDAVYFIIERVYAPDFEGDYEYIATEKIGNDFIHSFNINHTVYYSKDKILKKNSQISTSNVLVNNNLLNPLTITSALRKKITIGGNYKQYVERMQTRFIDNAKTGFLVDCGMSKHFNSPQTVIHGLEHLIKRNVIVLADGGVIKTTVDDNGYITLDRETTDITVGLPYEFEFETLGIEGENTHGLKKIINNISVNLLNSREDFWICGNNGNEMQLPRSYESVNDSGYLFSGAKEAVPLNTPNDKATIHIKQKYPLPITIAAVSGIVNVADIQDQ